MLAIGLRCTWRLCQGPLFICDVGQPSGASSGAGAVKATDQCPPLTASDHSLNSPVRLAATPTCSREEQTGGVVRAVLVRHGTTGRADVEHFKMCASYCWTCHVCT